MQRLSVNMGVFRGLKMLMLLLLVSALGVEGEMLPGAYYVDVDCHVNDPNDPIHNGLKIEVDLLQVAMDMGWMAYKGTPLLLGQENPTDATTKCIGTANEAVNNVFELFPYIADNDIPQCDAVSVDGLEHDAFKVTVYIPYRANLRLIQDKQVTFSCKPTKNTIKQEETVTHDQIQTLAELIPGGDVGAGPAIVSLSVVTDDGTGTAATDVALGSPLMLRAKADIADGDEIYWEGMKITDCRFESATDSDLFIDAVDANGCGFAANQDSDVIFGPFPPTSWRDGPDLLVDIMFYAFLFQDGGPINAKCTITVCSNLAVADCFVNCAYPRRRRRDATAANNTAVVSVTFTVGNSYGVSPVKTPSCEFEETNGPDMDGICFTMETTLALGIVALIVMLLVVVIITVFIMRLKSVGPWREEKKMTKIMEHQMQ